MKNNDLLAWMQSRGLGPAPTQAPAFGGIANPGQRAMLRGSDKAYLDARQKELDAYEAQRLAYNSGLTKYQEEVYKPYQAQAEAYNAAAQKYNTEVYNPYKTQYEAYVKSVEDYNAGPRTTDYAGPAEPTLASKFEMTLPTTPEAFSMTSPVLPFKEEDVTAYQKEAAQTARSDAANRGVAIDVVSDPSKYNFGSMSVSNRFMAEGGPVDAEPGGQARSMMDQMTGLVASAGRGGDTQLAHLSPQSAALLKSQGGAGTINPKTGLPEYLVMIMPAEEYDKAAKTNFKGMPLAGYQRGAYSPGYLEGLAAAEEARKKAAADAAAAALAESQRRDLQNAAAAKEVTERIAREKAAAEAAKLATEKEAARIFASRVRDQRVASPVTGASASTVRPVAANYNLNTRAATPLGPVDLDNRYIRTPTTPIGSRTPTYTSPNPSQQPREERPTAPTTLPTFIDNNLTRIPTAAEIALPDIGRQTSALTNPKNFFALDPSKPPSIPGLTPGTVALAPLDLPLAAGKKTLEAIAANPNLSPQMLGGKENARIMTDRLGNRIYSPGAGPLLYRSGGEVTKDLNALLAQNTENLSDEQPEESINTNPVGTAQAFLADLSGAGKVSPTRQSVKRVKTSAGGGATADKAMQLAYEDLAKGDLGVMKDRAPAMKNTESARSQMEELARTYQLKIRAAQNAAKGLSADTFGAPTLEGPTLTKGKLTKKRFKDGGEAKKSDAKKTKSGGFFSDLFKSDDADFIEDIKNKAEKNEDYRGILRYLQSRDAVPDVKTSYLPYGTDAVFNTVRLPIGSGTIKINRDIVGSDYKGDVGPSTLAHEMTHAADRQLEQQASEQSGIFKKGNNFTDAYKKMVGSGGMREGEKRTEAARKMYPKWASENRDYRSTPYEITAHGIGNFSGSTTADGAPPHIDATAATEFQILLDLAQRNSGNAVKRSEGSPVEGEESLDKYYAPKARTSTGTNRKKGPISQQLDSGEAYVNMAKGLTELPYDIAGAPVDLATMLLRPFGYSTEKPVMGSDWIKEQMTGSKPYQVRPEPPADPTAKGFYTAGELLSNLTNPAAVSRKVGPAVEKSVKAGAKEVGRQLDRAILDDAGPLANFVPKAAKPLYAVRPTGSTVLSGPVGMEENVSKVDQILRNGMTNATSAAGQNEGQAMILKDFWDKKARNYFTRQFGTPDDPIATAISKKQIKGTTLEETFPEYLIDQINVGKTRVNAEGQERFFPKYPKALEDFTSRYDKATGLKGNLVTLDPKAANQKYESLLSDEGKLQGLAAQYKEQDKLSAQGLRPELINTDVGTVTRSAINKDRVIGDGGESAKALLNAYEESKQFGKMDDKQKTNWVNQIFGEGRKMLGKNETEVGKNLLPQNVITAIDKGEPIYDIDFMRAPLTNLFDARSINQYLASIPPREAANIRFEDAVKGAVKLKEKTAEMDNIVSRIKAGKPVADTVFSKGVSGPLLQINEGPLEGFAWKRIEKREATVPEGAYVGHSVGGYETGGATYTQDKREGFNTGKWQVYTLRDNRNRPVNTIEVKMLDEYTPVVTQIKGNGRATGNTAPEKYDTAVINFLQNYLKPAAIEESNSHLTPLLQAYKTQLGSSPSTR
jgi:hypothetical protein